jgi:hypothetical protein
MRPPSSRYGATRPALDIAPKFMLGDADKSLLHIRTTAESDN